MDQLATQKDLSHSLQLVISDKMKPGLRKDLGWLKSEQRWTVGSFYHALEILKSGTGFCWAPAHLFHTAIEAGTIKKIPTIHDLSRTVTLFLVMPKSGLTGPATELMAKLIREESQKRLPPVQSY